MNHAETTFADIMKMIHAMFDKIALEVSFVKITCAQIVNTIMNVLFMKSVHRVDVLKLIQATVLMITIVMMTSIAMTRFVKWRSVNTNQIVPAMRHAKTMSVFIFQS
jgi:hypothetical protein